jgi:hypothetical protein
MPILLTGRIGGDLLTDNSRKSDQRRGRSMTFVKRIDGAAALGTLLTAGTLTGAHAAAMYTAIDLSLSGFTSSLASGVSDGQQVGTAFAPGVDHALLWTGTAASAVDLNPSGFASSLARGVGDGQQVGDGVVVPNVSCINSSLI